MHDRRTVRPRRGGAPRQGRRAGPPRKRARLAWAALSLGLAACGEPSGPVREISGQRLYNRNCARCHGLDGRPTELAPSARDLTNRAYVRTLSDDHLRRVIKQGVPPNMPAFGEQFMPPSLDALVGYVRELSEAQPAPPAP